jgi:hypothetical protein
MRETHNREPEMSWNTMPLGTDQGAAERLSNNRRDGGRRGAWAKTPWRGAPAVVIGRGWGTSRRS